MNLSKMRDGLQQYLHSAFHRHHGPLAELEQLIVALEKKDTNLQEQLTTEKDPLKRRHLKIELKVTRLQREKGLARRQELLEGEG